LVYYRYMDSAGIAGIAVSFVFVLCGALRLARFNIMPHTPYFLGLPIPGGAAFAASLVLFGSIYSIEMYTNAITAGMFMVAALMVSTVPYPALKKASKNKPRLFRRVLTQIGFWLIILVAYVITIEKAIFFAVISYLVSGLFFAVYKTLENKGYIELVMAKIKRK